MDFQLDHDEAALLERILHNYLPQLREEVYKTEAYDWRESLKKDEDVVKRLLARLESLRAKAD